jgi:hypothetical protein
MPRLMPAANLDGNARQAGISKMHAFAAHAATPSARSFSIKFNILRGFPADSRPPQVAEVGLWHPGPGTI